MNKVAAPPRAIGTAFNPRKLTWAGSFDDPFRQSLVQMVEYLSGKIIALHLIREFQRRPPTQVSDFWATVLDVMGIEIGTPASQISQIPKDGPAIVVANHPTGPLDGIILAAIVGMVRRDFKILTRDLMTEFQTQIQDHLISVPFWHREDAIAQGLAMRAKAQAHLSSGGCLAYFPSGAVAASKSWFGPSVEAQWNVFTAKLIRTSGATVVPVRFAGGPTRLYQIANKISPILRQGLLIHEIIHQRGRPQSPVIGAPILARKFDECVGHPRQSMAWLREHTLALHENS